LIESLLNLFFLFSADFLALSLSGSDVSVVFTLYKRLNFAYFLSLKLREIDLNLFLLRLKERSFLNDLPNSDQIGRRQISHQISDVHNFLLIVVFLGSFLFSQVPVARFLDVCNLPGNLVDIFLDHEQVGLELKLFGLLNLKHEFVHKFVNYFNGCFSEGGILS